MKINHSFDETNGVFYIEQEGKPVAKMIYTMQPGRMVIQHTEVDETLRGQNAGFSLVQQGIAYAREHHLKIVPLCKFAKKMIGRHKELQDVL